MTNVQKAREIVEHAHSSSFFPIEDNETFEVKTWGKTEKRHDDSLKPEIRRAIKYGAITMGVWKDEQLIEQLTAFAVHLNKRGAFRDDLCMDFEHEAQSFIELQYHKKL